jgi:hypothetical protein
MVITSLTLILHLSMVKCVITYMESMTSLSCFPSFGELEGKNIEAIREISYTQSNNLYNSNYNLYVTLQTI